MRCVLVTGGARRIGAAITRALAADGWHAIVHYRNSGEDAEALAREVAGSGGLCDTICADLGDREAVAELIPACTARFGPLSALVNNASSFSYDRLDTMTSAGWISHAGPNLEAPVFLSQAFARQCSGPGAIVNMLDHKVTAPNPDFFSYTVAKLGLAGATTVLAQALRHTEVRVNGVAPGIALLSGRQTEAGFQRAWTAPPLGRSCTPEELADACRFVLETGSLNGQVLVLDGGESLLRRQRDIAFESDG